MGKAKLPSAALPWVVPLALGAAVLAVYWPALPGAWLYDDAFAVTGNASLHSLATAFAPPANGSPVAGRPLLNASFAVDWVWGGGNVEAFLATNLVIHWLAACALFGVLGRTLALGAATVPSLQRPGSAAARPGSRALRRSRGAEATRPSLLLAFIVTLLWAVHPLCTSAVAYVSQRAESLAALCCLFALYCLVRGWRWAAVAGCAAGMAVKETMVVAPFILWLFDGAFLAASPREALRRRPGFYAGLSATWVVLVALVMQSGSRNGTAGFGSGVSALQYAAVQGSAILHYLRLIILPHPLVFLYPRVVAPSAGNFLADGVCLVLVAASVAAYVRGWRGAGFLGLAFFLWLAPSSSLLPISTEIQAEHRMYLPLAAALSLLAAVVSSGYALLFSGDRQEGDVRQLSGTAKYAWLVSIGALVSAAGISTMSRSRDYSTAVRLWAATAVASPTNPLVWNNLGTSLLDTGNAAEALPDFDRALAQRPAYPEGHLDRGLALVALDRMSEAAAEFEAALQLSPAYAKARRNAAQARLTLGNRAAQAGHLSEALQAYAQAAADNPDDPYVQNDYAIALRQVGRLDEAIVHYGRALALKSDYAQARVNLGVALAATGQNAAALHELELAAATLPEDASIRHNLDVVRRRLAASGQ